MSANITCSLSDLIEKAPSFESDDSTMCGTFVQKILEKYSAEDSIDENIGRLEQHNKSSLLDTIKYLKITYKGKHYDINQLRKLKGDVCKKKLAKIICNRLRAFHQNLCNLCTLLYTPVLESTQDEAFSCISCGIKRHYCATNFPPTCLWICQTCSASISPIYTSCLIAIDESTSEINTTLKSDGMAVTNSSFQPNSSTPLLSHTSPPLTPVINTPRQPPAQTTIPRQTKEPKPPREVIENTVEPDEIITVNSNQTFPNTPHSLQSSLSNSLNLSSSSNPKPSLPPSQPHKAPKTPEICPYLIKGICRYGAWGLNGGHCRSFHPEPCEKFLNYGTVTPYGCDKGSRCKYYHLPFFCKNSIKFLWCTVENCRELHHSRCSNFKPPPLPRSHLSSQTLTPSTSPAPTPPGPTTSLPSQPSPYPPTSPIPPSPSTSTTSTPIATSPPPPPSTPLRPPTNHTQINNHQPTSRPVPPPQNFIPSLPNYHPPPFLSPFHPPFYPMPPYLPQHLPIPFLYPPKPQVVAPQPHPSQPMIISPRIVSALEDLLTQMKNSRNN